MKGKRLIASLLVLLTAILLVGCRSHDNFGQRKTKDCNCTRWSK